MNRETSPRRSSAGNSYWLRLLATLAAVLTLHTFDLILRGNLEGLLLWGLGLSWLGVKEKKPLRLGLGLLLLSIKPINVLLVIAALLWVIRR